jgi:hypothetical protein
MATVTWGAEASITTSASFAASSSDTQVLTPDIAGAGQLADIGVQMAESELTMPPTSSVSPRRINSPRSPGPAVRDTPVTHASKLFRHVNITSPADLTSQYAADTVNKR